MLPDDEQTAEVDALAHALQKHDPEPYIGDWSGAAYYREYAAAIIASGLRVTPTGQTGGNS